MKVDRYNTLWGGLIVEELVRWGCRQFYICPGSRSTPLTAAAARHPKVDTTIVYDERGAGFCALGFARATGRPAPVITTSGTAVAGLFPAIMEASNDQVPLLLLSADRPPELIDTGANQTIIQTGLFAPYLRWRCDLACPTTAIDPAYVLTSVDQAMHRCQAGPVHINCAYREPLMDDSNVQEAVSIKSLRAWHSSDAPLTTYPQPKVGVSDDTLVQVTTILNQTQKGLLCIGRLDSDAERDAVRDLIKTLQWPVYADLSSGLRLAETGTNIIRYFDQALLPETFSAYCRPETVLHIGGRIVSKRVPLFLTEQRPDHFIVIQNSPVRYDPIHAVTCRVQGDIAEVTTQLKAKIHSNHDPEYASFFIKTAEQVDQIVAEHIAKDHVLSEPCIARRLTELIPDGNGLFVSNSMPVRDVDIYGTLERRNLCVGVNRGVSGIDGILATAVGFAQGRQIPTTVLLGDLAMIHDLNSLTLIGRSSQPVVVVVINNHGGGIFHFLPIAKQADIFEDYFVTPHEFSFEGVTRDCGLHYHRPETPQAFDHAYRSALQENGSALIEVITDGKASFHLRKRMKQAILTHLKASFDRRSQ